jgi:two-component system nitrogen regulation response regulator GlnG
MQAVYKAIGRVAPQDMTVLVTGESGTGKELVARALYHHGNRAGKPFLAINCAAIPESLLESELFGHDRGAFTGAGRKRIGKFEQCHGGTLFLDEIGDMSPATQAKVLRLLQEQRFERLGGDETIQVDVRVIAATNQSLEERVAAGLFRQDLFYRLNGFTIRLPPLRERMEDLPLLLDHFLRAAGRSMNKSVGTATPEVLAVLTRHDWPGNVREFQSAVRYAVLHAAGDVLTVDCLPEYLTRRRPGGEEPAAAQAPTGLDVLALTEEMLRDGLPDIYRAVVQAVERVMIERVLRHVKGNQVQASELLGVSRTTLRAKMQSLGMALEKQVATDTGS